MNDVGDTLRSSVTLELLKSLGGLCLAEKDHSNDVLNTHDKQWNMETITCMNSSRKTLLLIRNYSNEKSMQPCSRHATRGIITKMAQRFKEMWVRESATHFQLYYKERYNLHSALSQRKLWCQLNSVK